MTPAYSPTAKSEPCNMPERLHCFSICELIPQERNLPQESSPRRTPIHKLQLRRSLVHRRDSGTRNSVVETKNPCPSSIEDVMHGSIIDWIGRPFLKFELLQILNPPHARKVTVQPLSCRKIRKTALAQLQSSVQEAAWSGGIYNKPRCNLKIATIPYSLQVHLTLLIRDFP